jgi:hypothetical protein
MAKRISSFSPSGDSAAAVRQGEKRKTRNKKIRLLQNATVNEAILADVQQDRQARICIIAPPIHDLSAHECRVHCTANRCAKQLSHQIWFLE